MNQNHLRTPRGFRASEGGLPGRILTAICLAAAAVFFLAAGAAADNTLSVTPTSGTAPLTVTASFTTIDPLCNCDMFEIFWGDGNSTGLSWPYDPVTHTYTTAGSYTVELVCYGTDQGNPACEPQQTVTVSGGADTTPPSISITSPTTSPSYTTATTPITLGGTASDNVGVTQVTWANSQGGTGTASGTTSWSAAGISLQPGTNTITVTARDAANNTGTDQITVTYNPPDTTPPSISITSPTTSPSYTTATTSITLGGTASDNVGVTQVTWANSQGGTGTASGTTSWTAAGISLQPGTNTITVTARDAANNTGTDQITVTYNPPAGAFDVTASPASAGVVPDQQNVLSFMYTATAPGGGSFTVTSDQGRFTLPGGDLLETVSRTVSIQVTNGSGSAAESVSIPARAITAAQKAGNNRIVYERTFSYGGESAAIQVTLRMVPSSAGPFSFVRLALRFKADEGFQESFGPDVTIEEGRATVPRNFPNLSAVADITYNGGGLLRAQWRVDGQVIGYVTRYLYRGVREVFIESPRVPGLPVYDTGRHSVVFEVIDPVPGFEEPEIFYFVTGSEAAQQEPPAPAEDGQMRFENLEIEKKPEQQGFFDWIRPGPKPAYAAEGTGAFTVSKGDVLSLKATLVNETGVAQHNIRVEFAVDGQVVDASFINVIQPGESLTIEGEHTAPDNRSHIVEIRARDAEAPASEPLASIEGDMQGSADADKGPAEDFAMDTFTIAGFTVEIAELTDADTNNLTGTGTLVDVPFPGRSESIPVGFQQLTVDENGTVVQGTIEAAIDDITGMFDLKYASVDIDSITFAPDSAFCTGTVDVPMPFAVYENRLQIGFNSIAMEPGTGLSGEVPFELRNIDLSAILPGFGITMADGSAIIFQENELDSQITGSVSLPNGILDIPGIDFSGLSLASDGGFYGTAAVDTAGISGTQLGLSGSFVLDFTTTDSPGLLSEDAEWMGVYLETGSLRVSLFEGQAESEFELTARDLYISNGLNGTLETDLNQTYQTGEGSYRFELALTGLGLTFHQFRAGSGSLEGNILGNVNIPVVDVAADIKFLISPAGIESVATLSDEKSTTLADMVELTLKEGSSISVSGDLFEARLISQITALGDLGGDISAGLGATLVINSNGELSLEDPQGELAMWVGTQNCKANFFDVFSLGLDTVGFGIQGGHAFFGVGGSLCIMDGFEADAGATMGINIPGGKVWARDIHVAFEEPGAFSFSGEVTLLDDAEFGKGFRGEMELSVVDTFAVETDLIAGHTGDFPYFYIYGSMDFPAPGIQLNPYPVAFYGFGGGAYFNMEPDTFDGEPESYSPEEGSLGLVSSVKMGTSFDDGYTFNGEVTFEIAFDLMGSDRGFDLALRGEAYLLCNRTQPNINRRIYTDATFGCHGSCAFTSRMIVEDFAVVDPDKAVVAVSSEMDMKLAEDEWYFHMGTPEQPSTVDILPTWVDISGHGYFTADSTGLAAGLGMEVDTGKKTVLIFYGRLWGGMESDFAVNFKPAFIYAEFSVWMGLEAGLDLHELGKFEIIKAYAELNGGLRTPSPTRLWVRGRLEYSVLGGMFSGTWKMSFTWGKPVPEMYEPEAVWPCVDSVIPEHNTQEVTVATAVDVVLTQPEGFGNRITFPVESGETFYVGIEVEDVVVNTSAASLENPVPGDIEWNDTRTQLKFIPDGYLYPNADYYIHVEARAEGSPEMIEGGSWEDHYTAGFTTGGFPENLTPMVKTAHPYQGQKNWYTGYPIEISFNRPLDILEYEHVRGRLFKLSDNTEVPGQHSVFQPYANGVRFIPDAPLEPNTKYVYKLMRMTPEADQQEDTEDGGMQPAQPVGTMGRVSGSGLTVAGTETTPHRTSGSQTTSPTATPQGDTMAHPADEGEAGLPPGDMPQAGDIVAAMNDTWLTIAFETSGYDTFRHMLNASEPELTFEASTLHPAMPHPLTFLDDNPRYILEGRFETAEPVDWSQVNITVEPVNADYTTCGWDVEFHDLNDYQREVLVAGPRCAGRTMNEKLIVRKSEEEVSGPGTRTNRFVLELMPGPFHVVPVPRELQDSVDLWDRQLTARAFMLDHRPEAIELHETLLSETRITIRHKARPEEPYRMECNLLEEILALGAQAGEPADSGESGFTFDGARPQKPPADIEPDVDDSGGEAEDEDAGSQDDAGDTGVSGPVFDGQPPARGK